MHITRTSFFSWLFLMLVVPFPLQKLWWLAGSKRIMGKAYFTGHHWDIYGSVSSHLVVIFYPPGRDSVVFTNNVDLHLREDTPVPIRYQASNPGDARVDVPVCIWGDTLVWMLVPVGVWLVLLVTPKRFDPLIPRGSVIQLRRRRPFIRVLVLGAMMVLSLGVMAQKKDTTTLKQATVTARPVFVQKADRLVVNVDAMIAQGGTSVLELLERLPGLMVDPNGTIRFNGRTGVLILIDDKPTYLSAGDLANYLRSLPSAMLDRIELMSNPPAKYDAASGAGVIMLRMKKLTEKGWNLQASAMYGQAYYGRTNESLAGNIHQGKVNVYGNFSFLHQDSYRHVTIDREYFNPDGSPQSFFAESSTYSPVRTSPTARLGLDYYLTPATTIGVLWMGVFSTSDNHSPETSTINAPSGKLDSFTTAENSKHDYTSNQHLSLNVSHNFRKPGATLTADADYISYRSRSDQLFLNTTYDSSGLPSTDNEQAHLPTDIRVYTAKSDYTLPVTTRMRLETGAKYSSVRSDNIADYYDLEGSTPVPDYDKTNHFLYDENIEAAYGSLTHEGHRLSWQGGLRLESTGSQGHQLGNVEKPDSSFMRRYTDLFPTGFISYGLDTAGRNHLRLSYGRRINRPNYQDLNPFIFVINRFTWSAGNPYLKPQYSDNLELAWQYKRLLTTTLFYNYTRDVQQEIIQSVGSVFISQTGNIGHRTNLGLSVNVNAQPAKGWATNAFIQVIDGRYDGLIGDSILRTNVVSWSVNWNNQIVIAKGWAADLGGNYNSANTQGQFVTAPVWLVYAGIQRKLLRDRAVLRLAARDIFHTYQPRGHLTTIPLTTASFRNYVDTQVVALSFSYSLSKGKTKKSRKADGAAEEQGRIGN